jgi:hypothetical protein
MPKLSLVFVQYRSRTGRETKNISIPSVHRNLAVICFVLSRCVVHVTDAYTSSLGSSSKLSSRAHIHMLPGTLMSRLNELKRFRSRTTFFDRQTDRQAGRQAGRQARVPVKPSSPYANTCRKPNNRIFIMFQDSLR